MRLRVASLAFVLLLVCFDFLSAQATKAVPRVALVIGNSNYTDMPKLKNPVNDATDLAAALTQLGFKVTLLTNVNRKAMNQAIVGFRETLGQDRQSEGVFFFAGHGVQSKGVNYLIPMGADIQAEVDLDDEAVSAQKILGSLEEARNRVNLVILDACRDNPLPSALRSSARGLAVVTSAPPETLILYSTAAGQTAFDGEGRNSPFALALLAHIGDAGDVTQTVKAITGEVKKATGGQQIPYVYMGLSVDFAMNPLKGDAQEVEPAAAPVKKPTLTVEETYGSVTIQVQTKGTLYLNGKSMGELSPGPMNRLDDLEVGQVNLEMHYENGQTESKQIEVRDNAVTAVSFTYEKTYGSITVRVKIPGILYLNGRALGRLAPGYWRLDVVEAGQANLEMRYEDGKTESQTVEVISKTKAIVYFTHAELPKSWHLAWTNNKAAGSNKWSSITSSSDGSHLAACVYGGYIYISITSGSTWTEQKAAGSRDWHSITSSSDGSHLAACASGFWPFGGSIYTSSDGGSTWTERKAAGSRDWCSIASSSDGSHLAACDDHPGYIYTSNDGGSTWTEQKAAGSRDWSSITSSSDGSHLAACIWDGYIYTSIDYGNTWTVRNAAGSWKWISIASSFDGSHLAACAHDGHIYTSNDGGITWTEQKDAGSYEFKSISSSFDGSHLLVCCNGYFGGIRASSEGGIFWTHQEAGGSWTKWRAVTSSSDGGHLAACDEDGEIYTAQ